MPKKQSLGDAFRLMLAGMPQNERDKLTAQLNDQRQHVGKGKAAMIDNLKANLQAIWTENPPTD